MPRLVFVVASISLIAGGASAQSGEYTMTRVAALEFPTSVGFAPDGSLIFVAERTGRVRVIRDGTLEREPFTSVRTTTAGEGGLLGLAVDPDFDSGEPWVYLFHTLADGSANRVLRVRYEDGRAGQREVLMSRLPAGAALHHGGIITFGPDDKLYVSHGEAHEQSRAQDPQVLGGKIYRIDRDGSIPSDNPFRGSPTWSYGHRNPFGLAFDPDGGRLWSLENGPQNHDEVNLIERGANYGWPIVRGDQQRRGMTPAVVDYAQIVVPTGLAFGAPTFGGSAARSLFLGTYSESAIHELELNDKRTDVVEDRVVVHDVSVVAMVRGPDGIYVSTPDALMKLHTAPAASPSPSASPTASPSLSPDASASNRGIGFVIITLAALGGYQLARWLRRSTRPRPRGPWLGGRDEPK